MSTEILIVDDNHINVIYLQTMLTKLGFSAVSATSGQSAIDLCQHSSINKTPFKLILMDIRMDGMDGIETTQSIRQLAEYQAVPIIAVSAEQVPPGDDKLFQQTVIKPINRATLVDLTTQYLQPGDKSEHQPTEGNSSVLQQLRQMLRQQLPQDIEKLKKFLNAHDGTNVRQHIHYILGSVKMCQLTDIELILNNLQQAVMNEGSFHQTQLMDQLEQASKKFCQPDVEE